MEYAGAIRIDLGPLTPHADTIKAIERNNISGMECIVDTTDLGKITIEAFDDYAILNIMDVSDRSEDFHYLLSMTKTPKEIIYTSTSESPEFGMLGDPIKAIKNGHALYKAIAVHGKVKKSNKVQAEGYPPLLIMELLAQGISISAAVKFSAATQDMKNLNTQIISGLDPWAKVSGYGEISFLKVDGKKTMRIYINTVKYFTIAENKEIDWPQIHK